MEELVHPAPGLRAFDQIHCLRRVVEKFVVEFHPVLFAAVVVNYEGIGCAQSRVLRTTHHLHGPFFNGPGETYQSDSVAHEVENGSPNVRLGEAWKGSSSVGVVAVVGLDQAKTPHLQEIVAF